MSRALTVSQLNQYVASIMAQDYILRSLIIKGEISNFRKTAGGHAYFALKDQSAIIKCVIFKKDLAALEKPVQDGESVIAYGYVSLYAKEGQYQLYVQSIESTGTGRLYEEFERLKKEMAQKGFFDEANKRIIDLMPRTIGIVTSPTGAVIHDIINVANRRFPGIALMLCPAKVQGEGAAEQIAGAIGMLNMVEGVDTIIIGRGGGSIEDLWAFNEPVVIDAIMASGVPIISAVGHETDFTIADFVADLRAPTPSAAAEMAVPLREHMLIGLERIRERLYNATCNIIDSQRKKVMRLSYASAQKNPKAKLQNNMQHLDHLLIRLINGNNNIMQKRHISLESLKARLSAASPLGLLQKGYAIIKSDGKIAASAKTLKQGQKISIYFYDGSTKAIITEEMGEAHGGFEKI